MEGNDAGSSARTSPAAYLDGRRWRPGRYSLEAIQRQIEKDTEPLRKFGEALERQERQVMEWLGWEPIVGGTDTLGGEGHQPGSVLQRPSTATALPRIPDGSGAEKPIVIEQPRARRRSVGRPRKRDVGGLTVDQWMVVTYMEDVQNRYLTVLELWTRCKGRWGKSTIRNCSTFKSVQAQLKIEERARADDLREELVAEGEGPGLHLSKRKSRVGRQRRSAGEAAADRAADDFLRQHDKKPPRG